MKFFFVATIETNHGGWDDDKVKIAVRREEIEAKDIQSALQEAKKRGYIKEANINETLPMFEGENNAI